MRRSRELPRPGRRQETEQQPQPGALPQPVPIPTGVPASARHCAGAQRSWPQRSVSRPVHVTAGPRDPCRRDPSRSLVSETSRSLLASAFRPLPDSAPLVALSCPRLRPRKISLGPGAGHCLSLIQAPNKVSSFKSVFLNPPPSLSRLLPRASTASSPAAGETRALESGARNPVMAGRPASLSARDVGFVSLSSATLSAPFPPPRCSGKLSLVGNLWVLGEGSGGGLEAPAPPPPASSSPPPGSASLGAMARFLTAHGEARARRPLAGLQARTVFAASLLCDSWLLACLHGNGLRIPTGNLGLPLPLSTSDGSGMLVALH